jgi:hypothetical protein
MEALTNSFISILNVLIDHRRQLGSGKAKRKPKRQITGTTTFGELSSGKHDCDDLDLQLASLCFEVSHRIVIPVELSDNEALTIEEFTSAAGELPREGDPMFATRRIATVAYASWVGVYQAANEEIAKESRHAKKHERN